jgi:anti-sigma regulatory factor (Ser/Thr protein kinase)
VDAHASFPAELRSATAARRFAERSLGRIGCSDATIDDARLLVSELVINSVLHAGSPTLVTLRCEGRSIRVEVRDESPRPPVRRPFSGSSATGRGLMIVDAVADRWGYETGNDHKVVWFELGHDGMTAPT